MFGYFIFAFLATSFYNPFSKNEFTELWFRDKKSKKRLGGIPAPLFFWAQHNIGGMDPFAFFLPIHDYLK